MIKDAWGKIRGSISGWEKSHFGGFYRMIVDYPYIKLDSDFQIELDPKLTSALGWYNGEKLIKLYLLKAKESNVDNAFTKEPFTQINPYTGEEEQFVKIYLNHSRVMSIVEDNNEEMALLFEHYRAGIFNSLLIYKVPEDGEGEGEGEDEGEDDQDQDQKEKELQEAKDKKNLAKMQQALDKIKEFKPFDPGDRLSGYEGKVEFKVPKFDKSVSEYSFKNEEIRDAENLLKLLDISFEPKSDVVRSLRAGKLDTAKIAEIPAGTVSIYKQTVEDQDTKPFGICILADLSGSMCCGNRLQMQHHTLNTLFLALSQIVPADKLWIYGHTGDEYPEVTTFHTPYNTDYARNIREYYSIDNGSNYDGPVIEAIYKKVRESCDDNIIFISLSDGQPAGDGYGGEDDIIDMKRILERARRDGFVTVSIGMQYMATPGLYQYNKTVDDLSQLAKDVSQVVNKVVKTEFK